MTATSTGAGRCGLGHAHYILYGPLANGATADVRGVPNYPDASRFWKWWTSTRSTSSTPPHRHPRADGRGRRLVKKGSRKSCASSLGRRADQPGSLGMVLQRVATSAAGGGTPVADRERRDPDRAAAGATDSSRARRAAFLRRVRCSSTMTARSSKVPLGQHVHRRAVAGHDAHGVRRPRALIQTYFSSYKGKYFTGDAAAASRTATTGSPPVDDVINVSGHRRHGRVGSRVVARQVSRPPSSPSRTTSRARASTAT